MACASVRPLVRKNGYELVELLRGARPGEQLLCRSLRELRQADGEARGRRQLRLHLREVEEIDSAKPP